MNSLKDVQGIDKMYVEDYIKDIVLQTLSAISSVEKEHPDWQFKGIDIEATAVLKPVKLKDGTVRVVVDLDEPDKFPRSTIPMRLDRI